MKKTIMLAVVLMLQLMTVAGANDNRPNNWSRERFMCDLERFIACEACLTPNEAAAFFPVFQEMYKKQRVVFDQMRNLDRLQAPVSDQACKEAIKTRDKLDLELKRIQQTYHNKFMSILPPHKVYDIIKAEDKFHRQMLKRWSKDNRR